MSVKPAVMRRLMKEIAELQTSPPEGIRIQTSDDNMLDVTGIIQGPEGTPYSSGFFKVKFHFTEEFPAAPPKCRMVTKIFHPNVSTAGEICVNTLKKDWQSSFGIAHILVTVKCLLIYPNPESALDEEAGKLLLEDYDEYCGRARLITSVHAKARPAEFGLASPLEETKASSSKPSTSKTTTTKASSTKSAPTKTLAPPFSAFAFGMAPVSGGRVVSGSSATSIGPSAENDGVPAPVHVGMKTRSKDNERHLSPAPLGTADGNVANVKDHASPLVGTPVATTATKAVKRSATAAANGAEKKKKALKRL